MDFGIMHLKQMDSCLRRNDRNEETLHLSTTSSAEMKALRIGDAGKA